MQPTLYLMMGYPGAGKTTTAKIIAKLTGAVHLASDKIRFELFAKPTFNQKEHDQLYQAIDRKTESLLHQGVDVIYDANLNRYRHRQEKYDICKRTNAKPVLVWVETPKDLAKQRATHHDRIRLAPNSETLDAMFERIANVIEEPRAEEHAITIVGQNITDKIVRNKLGI